MVDDPVNAVGLHASMTIGLDGNPVISYYDLTDDALKVATRNDPQCTGGDETITTVDDPANVVGADTTIAIGFDGNPIIGHRDATVLAIKVLPCPNATCSGESSSESYPRSDIVDLDGYLDDTGYDAVSTSDNIYDTISAASSSIVYNARAIHTNNSDDISITWEGQTDGSQDIDLEIYRFGSTNAWVNLDSQSSPIVDTDYTLTNTITTNLSEYYDGSNTVYSRAVLATTSSYTTFSTDEFEVLFGASAAGALTLGNTGNQEVNVLDDQTGVIDVELLNFALTATDEVINVTNVVIELFKTSFIGVNDFTSIELWRDENQNGSIDGGDTQVGGTGSLTTINNELVIQFSTTFAQSVATNDYILRADIANIKPGSEFLARVSRLGFTATGQTSSESISATGRFQRVYHANFAGFRAGESTGGGGAPSAGTVAGGNEGGGGSLGSDPNYEKPTGLGSLVEWTNSSNAYSSNDTYALASVDESTDYTTFNLNVPSGNTIEGIEVRLEASASTNAGTIGVELSWDGGSTFTSTAKVTETLATTDTIYTLGGPSDLWGETWDSTEFSNANFRVRINANPGVMLQLDTLDVRVYDTASGAGEQGGGGMVYLPWQIQARQTYVRHLLEASQPTFLTWLHQSYVEPTLGNMGEGGWRMCWMPLRSLKGC